MRAASELAWSGKRLKYAISLRRDRLDDRDANGKPYVGLDQIESNTGRLLRTFDLAHHGAHSASSTGTTFERGDVLFGKLRPYLAKAWVAEFPGRCTTELLALTPREVDARFLMYVLLSPDFLHAVNSSTFGSKMPRAEWAFISNLRVPLPSIQQQRTIADYLDRETTRLDRLVEEKDRILRLLAEKRHALITRAVTRGLQPNMQTRDSGVAWLGEIPVHWTATRLKFVADVRTGLALGRRVNHIGSMEYPYLSVANVQDGHLDLSNVKTVHMQPTEAGSFALHPGDVLMNEGGDHDKLGRGCVWRGEITPCLHQNHVFAVRPKNVRSEWLNLWTSSEGARGYFETRAKRATNLASISASNIKELPVPMPCSREQAEIIDHVTVVGAILDRAREIATRTMSLLAERRSAVISAALARIPSGVNSP